MIIMCVPLYALSVLKYLMTGHWGYIFKQAMYLKNAIQENLVKMLHVCVIKIIFALLHSKLRILYLYQLQLNVLLDLFFFRWSR